MKSISLFALLALNFLSATAQEAISESSALQYLDQNYFELEDIEGIYEVDVVLSEPMIKSPYCEYNGYTWKNYDKVAIIKSGDHFLYRSISNRNDKGKISYEVSKYGYKTFILKYNIDGLNNGGGLASNENEHNIIKKRYPDFEIELPMVDYSKVVEYFPSVSTFISIKCPKERPIEARIMFGDFRVEFKYRRVFPLTGYLPQAKRGFGSGFIVNSKGLILTNYHVIREDYINSPSNSGYWNRILAKRNDNKWNYIKIKRDLKLTMKDKNGVQSEYHARVLNVDSLNDLALIVIDDSAFKKMPEPPYGFSTAANLGQSVFTLGYPLQNVMGKNVKLIDGMISGLTGIDDDESSYTLNLNVNPGNSGGPLFDQSGNIVGIVYAKLNDKSIGFSTGSVSYAIKANRFIEGPLYPLCKFQFDGKINLKIANEPRENLINKLSPYMVSISSTIEYTLNVQDKSAPSYVEDVNGKIYKTVEIGEQVWMAENLSVNKYNNGDLIPSGNNEMELNTALKKSKPMSCYYGFNKANEELYGRLYNIYVIEDPRNVCPMGWRIPKEDDWRLLTEYLGGQDSSYVKMKTNQEWFLKDGSNVSGFSALPGGYYLLESINDSSGLPNDSSGFYGISENATWWSIDFSSDSTEGNYFDLSYWSNYGGQLSSNIYTLNGELNYMNSIRCIKND